MYDDGYGYDCEDDYDYEGDYDYGGNYEDYLCGEYENSNRDSEDEEEDYSDGYRSSWSPDEHEQSIKGEDDETIVRVTNSAHLSGVEGEMVDFKQEIKEEISDGLVIGFLADPKLEKEEASASFVPDTAPESAASGSCIGERTSCSSKIGPEVQTEGKRVSGF